MNLSKLKNIYRDLGPGLLWAGAAIGVSHLVQSTRAGASYGFLLITVIIIANILKYPFFEFGPRYAAATGESLLDAYAHMGKGYFILFLILTFGTMFSITAAVTVVTAGLAAQITGIAISPLLWSAALMAICILILGLGSYKVLDKTIKYVIIVLSLSTLAAVILALFRGAARQPDFTAPSLMTFSGVAFMAALIGWMPSAIDISVWHSIWTLEKEKISEEKPHFRRSILDFNLGYIGTAIIAIAFLMLGALIMYGSGEQFPSGGAAFAGRFLSLYEKSLGHWSYPLIALAAFTTMFSTTITVLDAYPRVLQRAWSLLFPEHKSTEGENTLSYWIFIIFTAIGALLLLSVFTKSMTLMVDIATTLSFITAPVLAVLNYKAIRLPNIPEFARLPRWLNILSIVGIAFLSLFALAYLYMKFFM